MKIGLVYYEDDPEQRIFRMVYPTIKEYDEWINGPEAYQLIHRIDWLEKGVDPNRTATIEFVDEDDPRLATGMTGKP